MARPIKHGLDYFPLNITLSGSVEYLRCVYGKIGEAVIISLWQRIYENSYYIDYGKMSPLVFSQEFGNQLELCFPEKKMSRWEIYDEIVRQAVEFGVFDKAMFEKYSILTSAAIQKIYTEVKRKNAREFIDERYLLISEPQIGVSAAKTSVFDAKTPENVTQTPQSKEKKNKEKQSKAESGARADKKQFGQFGRVTLSDEEYAGLAGKFGTQAVDDCIRRMDEYLCENNRNYINCSGKIEKWISEDMARENRGGKSKFNNYTDTNKPDYSDFGKKIIDEMLKGETK